MAKQISQDPDTNMPAQEWDGYAPNYREIRVAFLEGATGICKGFLVKMPAKGLVVSEPVHGPCPKLMIHFSIIFLILDSQKPHVLFK